MRKIKRLVKCNSNSSNQKSEKVTLLKRKRAKKRERMVALKTCSEWDGMSFNFKTNNQLTLNQMKTTAPKDLGTSMMMRKDVWRERRL